MNRCFFLGNQWILGDKLFLGKMDKEVNLGKHIDFPGEQEYFI